MNIELQAELLKLKGLLNNVSHASFAYAQFEKKWPMHTLNDEHAKQLVETYKEILETVRNSIMNYEQRMDKTT